MTENEKRVTRSDPLNSQTNEKWTRTRDWTDRRPPSKRRKPRWGRDISRNLTQTVASSTRHIHTSTDATILLLSPPCCFPLPFLEGAYSFWWWSPRKGNAAEVIAVHSIRVRISLHTPQLFRTKCCQMLPNKCCQMLPSVAKCCQMLPNVAKCCQMLPNVAKCCQNTWNTPDSGPRSRSSPLVTSFHERLNHGRPSVVRHIMPVALRPRFQASPDQYLQYFAYPLKGNEPY